MTQAHTRRTGRCVALAAAGVLVVAALGAAGPASADPRSTPSCTSPSIPVS